MNKTANEKQTDKVRLTQIVLICLLPAVILAMQLLPDLGVYILLGMAIVLVFVPTKFRHIFLLFSLIIGGYLVWYFSAELISDFFLDISKSSYLAKTMGRFALFGYIVLLGGWHLLKKSKSCFLHLGNMKGVIKFPLIWKGIKEPIWRFSLIFASICAATILIFAFTVELSLQLILYGILFSLVNAALEELIWRGLILTKLIDLSNEKVALIVSATSFGLYHISLGFPIWACFVFAIGGFYMGGAAITSKGLLIPTIMHIMVNLIFVFAGIIF